MDYLKFGKTGLGASRLCIGCMTYGIPDRGPHPWTLDEEKSRPLIRQALDLGTDFVDLYQIHRWDPKVPIRASDRRGRGTVIETDRRRDQDAGGALRTP